MSRASAVLELVARGRVVEIVRDRRDGAVVQLELATWIAAGREQQLGPAQRRPLLLLIELDPLPGQPGEAK